MPEPPQVPRDADEDRAYILRTSGTPLGTLACNGGFVILSSQEEYNNLKNAGVPEIWLESFTLNSLITDARSNQQLTT